MGLGAILRCYNDADFHQFSRGGTREPWRQENTRRRSVQRYYAESAGTDVASRAFSMAATASVSRR